MNNNVLLSNVTQIEFNFFFNNHQFQFQSMFNCIGGVMVTMLASSVVGHGLEPQSGQSKDYKNGICCFSAKHAELKRKSKDWLARNQDDVSEWGDMSIHGLLFQ